MINKNIVLIADRIYNKNERNISCTTFEKLSDNYFNDLYKGLKAISKNVFHYDNPDNFLENISKHKNDFLITLWSGENSRNRKSLIPSICEAYNIMHLGADTYVQTISQDKNLSKIFCESSEILTPRSKLIFDENNLHVIETLKLPLVVKPNFEGGSIGISTKNFVKTYEEARKMIKELLHVFNQPILVEEFIEGDEVNFVIAGHQDELFLEAMKLHSDEIEISKHIWSYELKILKDVKTKNILCTDSMDKDLIEKIKNLYFKLGKVDVMRIDGRIKDNKFYCIELTPDMSLSPRCFVSEAFIQKGFTYAEALEKLIKFSIVSYSHQNANKK